MQVIGWGSPWFPAGSPENANFLYDSRHGCRFDSGRRYHFLNTVDASLRDDVVAPRSRHRLVSIALADAAVPALLLDCDQEDDSGALLEAFLDREPGTFHAPL